MEVKRFQFVRDTQSGRDGLSYLYHYMGEIHIPTDNLVNLSSGISPRIAMVQSLYSTHFVDRYEMDREYPELTILGGKIHNIETIKDKEEQNMFVLVKTLTPGDIEAAQRIGNTTVIRFQIPILVHATVLRPQLDQDYVEVGIPKNAKVYINFLKPHLGQMLKGRFSTDCLFETFVGVGMIDDNVHRRTLEVRHTLNLQTYRVCMFLTYAFLLMGILIFLKLIFMGEQHIHQHPHSAPTHIQEMAPLIHKTDRKEKNQ